MKAIELINKIQDLKDKRDAIAVTYDDQIKGLSAELEQQMTAEGLKKVEGKAATASWRNSSKAVVSDWSGLMDYIQHNGAFDLLQRSLSTTALKQRQEAGEVVPFVELETSQTFIVQKKRGK